MLPLLKPICEALTCPVAALPVAYRTNTTEPTFWSLHDTECDSIPDNRPFLTALDPFTCNRYEIHEFTCSATNLGVKYFGLCCGTSPHHVRSMAEALGRKPPSSRYAPNMDLHSFLGTSEVIRKEDRDYKSKQFGDDL